MPRTIQVDLTRTVDRADLVEALAAWGLEGEPLELGDHLALRVRAASGDPLRLGEFSHLLESWVSERGLPLVPMRVGDESFVVRPPAA